MKRVSTVSAELEYAPVEADIGINVGGFKVEVVPECQLRSESLEKDGWRVQPFITNHSRIIDERRIWKRISRWGGYAIVRCDPKRRWNRALVANQPSGNAGGATLSKFSLRVLRPKHGSHLSPITSYGVTATQVATSKTSRDKFRNSIRVNVRFSFAIIVADARRVHRMPSGRVNLRVGLP